jgi:hypothetical protein
MINQTQFVTDICFMLEAEDFVNFDTARDHVMNYEWFAVSEHEYLKHIENKGVAITLSADGMWIGKRKPSNK